MSEDFPAWGFTFRRDLLDVDSHHDALAAEALGGFAYKLGIGNGGGIDRDFVGPGIEHGADIVTGSDAAPNSERNEDFAGNALNHFYRRGAVFMTGGDIEKGDFVGTLHVVALRNFNGVSGITNADKIDALDHTAGIDIKAGNNTLGQTHVQFPVGRFEVSSSHNCWAWATSSVPS